MSVDKSLFESMPVPKAILKSAVPAIVGMVVVLVYNIADTYFVGQTGDAMQVAAVSLAMPVFLLFMAMGNLIGIGGMSVISRALGSHKVEHAKHVSSFSFYASIVSGLAFTALFLISMPVLLQLIGSSSETIGLAREYLTVIAPAAPFVILSVAFSNIVRAEGKSKEAMLGTLIGTVINIVLDPIMILGMDMGVAGAAWATLIGNVFSAIYYVHYLAKRTQVLSMNVRDFQLGAGVFTGVMAIGVPAALNNILMSASNIVLNNFLAKYGDIPVAAMGVAMKVFLVVVLLQVGLGVGIQPLLGYSFGARHVKRFKSTLAHASLYSIILGTLLTLFCWFGSGVFVRSFIDSEEVYRYGVQFVRAIILPGPIVGLLFVFMNTLQAMGAAKESLILSVSRQGLVFIPFLIIMDRVFGLSGIVYSQPAADTFSVLLSIALFALTFRKFKVPTTEPVPTSSQEEMEF